MLWGWFSPGSLLGQQEVERLPRGGQPTPVLSRLCDGVYAPVPLKRSVAENELLICKSLHPVPSQDPARNHMQSR